MTADEELLERAKKLLEDLVHIRELADSGQPTVANQGQALDGISERAAYRALVPYAKGLLADIAR